jgi:hypothetical protein
VVGALNKLSDMEMFPTSHCPGNIEAACKLLSDQMNANSCGVTNQNTMIVAITNGNFVINGRHR